MGKLEFFIGSDDKVWIRQGDSYGAYNEAVFQW